jgi:hypothetical protein
MEENILIAPPEYKLYRDRAIYLATFLGGPLVAGYLIGENYRNLGEKNLVWRSWIYAFIATVLIFAMATRLPETTHHTSYIIPILYAAMTQYLVKRLQRPQLAIHERNGGQFYSIWRAALVSLIGLALIIGGVLLFLYAQG